MKAPYILLGLWAFCLHAQNASTSLPTTGYVITQRALNSRVWQEPLVTTNVDGTVSTNIASYTEVRSGLCYMNEGVLVDSSDEIDLVADGAQAVHGQHSVHWNANLATPGGAVHLVTAGGQVLQSAVFGISYWDTSTGTNLLLGAVQDSQGTLIGNQVVYSNAFKGNGGAGINADVAYIYSVEGLEQNVVLRQQLPDPSSLGLDPVHTYLQVLTEFFNPPVPFQQSLVTDGVTNDMFLNFGDMSMGMGQAFLASTNGGVSTAGSVQKQWTTIENRTFLIEQIPYSQVSGLQQELPAHASISKPAQRISRLAALREKPSLKPPQDFGALKLASAYSAQPGLVIDYSIVNSVTNMTFQQGSTYYLSGNVSLSGTNTFEGGAVIKFTNNASITENAGPLTPQVNFLTGPYRPLICTAKDDNSVGQTVNGSTGNPFTNYYANPALSFAGYAPAISNIRVSYAAQAISLTAGNPTITDAQFVKCAAGVSMAAGTLTIENALFDHVAQPFCALSAAANVTGENMTVDGSSFLITFSETSSSKTVTFTNCIFAQITNCTGNPNNAPTNYPYSPTGSDNGFYGSPTFGVLSNAAASFPFQTVEAGNFYLATNCPFATEGSAQIDAALLADLAQRTVFPPTVVSNQVLTGSQVWNPTVPRDNSSSYVALGYHYSPLDYLCSQLTISSALVLTNGTAAALFGAVGFYPLAGGVSSYGNANTLNQLVWYPSVQEQGLELSGAAPPGNAMFSLSNGAPNFLTLNFTAVSMLGARQPLLAAFNAANAPILTAKNCQWHAVDFSMSSPPASPFITAQITLQNNLFERCSFSLYNQITNTFEAPLNLSVYNNLFWSNTVTLVYSNIAGLSTAWTVCDNLLDGCGDSFVTNNVTPNYNAFHNSSVFGGPNNVSLTALTYATGPLGNRYTNSSTPTLINMGSRSAPAAGLYHYTMSTNLLDGLEIPETNTTVDIGFHYVATDAYGNPLDTDNDGLPDYIKDANGDGLFDAGDLFNWQFPFYIYDQGKTYGGYTPKNLRLGYWRFNNPNPLLTNQSGQAYIYSNEFNLVPSWSGNAVPFTNSSSQLRYNIVSNDWQNLSVSNGSFRFWYQANWTTGAPNGLTSTASNGTLVNLGTTGGAFHFTIGCDGASNTYLTFSTSSGPYAAGNNGYFWAPFTFRSNLWYQIALTYSPSNMACYVNGELVTTSYLPPQTVDGPLYEVGNGLAYYPSSTYYANGFSIGNNIYLPGVGGGNLPVLGQIDELETFNYPLSYKAIAYGFPTFAGCTTNNALDSDYDGRSDLLEILVDGTNANNPNSVVPCRLGYWRFDTPDLIGEQGQVPLSSSNVTLVPSWSGTALNISSAASSHVTYPDVSSNGWANINCRHGAVRFWYKPKASGVSGTFFYMGSANASDAWTLNLTSGDTISFDTQTNEMGYTPVIDAHVAPLSPSKWTQIVLNYSATNCSLYVNGAYAGGNTGNTNWPSPSNRALGIVVGNAAGLSSPINGQIDELETFNYLLAASDISNNFQLVANVDSDLNGIPDLLEDIQLSTSRPFLGQPFVVTGTLEAEQFDMGSNGVAYYTVVSHPTNSYRPTGMFITPCNDILGATNITTFGYCLDQTCAGEWVKYTINVLVPQIYTIEARVAGIGTNGYFSCGLSNAALGAYTNTGPLIIPTTNWTLVSTNVWLAAGTNVMTLSFLTNGLVNNIRGTNVGRFNYISIYPWWAPPPPWTNTQGSNYVNLGTGSDWLTASNNAYLIQSNLNALPANGGIVQLPAGIFYVSQKQPNETNDCQYNTTASIYSSNVKIAGAGKTSTTLIGFNRATTIIYIGWNPSGFGNFTQCSNITIRDLTLEAQPHQAVNPTNDTQTIFELGGLLQAPKTATGALIYNQSPGASQYNYNILITNCQFLFADCAFGGGSMSNVLLTSCAFIVEGGTNVYTDETNSSPTPHTQLENDNVQVFAWALNFNAIGNSFNGNTNLVPTNSNPFGYVNTNDHQLKTPTGFIWLQSEGNVFVARNAISNYWGEAIQLNVGPNSVVGNSFYSLQNDISACALCSGASAWSGFTPIDYTTSFVGNWIYGGTLGAKGAAQSNAFNVDVSGNYLTLYPPLIEYGVAPGSIAAVAGCGSLIVIGNTLNYGGLGIDYQTQMTNLILMDNNLSGAAYCGMGRVIDPNGSIQNAAIFRNILSDGVTYHVQLPIMNTFGWFLRQNTYLDPFSNSIPAFLDPQSSSVHLNQ